MHLAVHSEFSLLAGTRPVADLVAAAAKLAGMPALQAHRHEQRRGRRVPERPAAQGIHRCSASSCGDGRRRHRAGGGAGYAEICRLVTRRHLDAEFRLGEALAGSSEHVFVLCGDSGLLAGLRRQRNVYVEIVCHHDVESRRNKYRLLDLATRLQLPIVATNNVHFLQRDEHRIHRVLGAIRTNRTIGTLPPGEVEHEECWLRSPGEMAALFDDVPEALANSVHIAWSCQCEFTRQARPPRFTVPQMRRAAGAHRMQWRRESPNGWAPTTAAKRRVLVCKRPRRFPEWRDAARSLYGDGAGAVGADSVPRVEPTQAGRTHRGARARCLPARTVSRRPGGAHPAGWARGRRRAQRELDVIHQLDLTEYFLVCWDLVRFARRRMPCLGAGFGANGGQLLPLRDAWVRSRTTCSSNASSISNARASRISTSTSAPMIVRSCSTTSSSAMAARTSP